ncbi:MAG: VOC family protein [Flavobacteriaceae bacterium]
MTTVNVYLTFNGNCEEAFTFYKSVFGGEFPYVGRFSEMPPQEGMPPIDEKDKHLIMHISLPIGGDTILMGSDSVGEWAQGLQKGTNFSISINTDTKEEADRIFAQLSKGGKVTMPLHDSFWNAYFGMFTDKFGIQWMINVNLEEKK